MNCQTKKIPSVFYCTNECNRLNNRKVLKIENLPIINTNRDTSDITKNEFSART